LATAWVNITKLQSPSNFIAGSRVCLVGHNNPGTSNGGIWRIPTYIRLSGTGTDWGPNSQVTLASYWWQLPAIVTGAACYGTSNGLCKGSPAVSWHKCNVNDALCENSSNPNIINVYEYNRPSTVTGAIYVDDPDVINVDRIWANQNAFLNGASCLPGASCSRAANMYQTAMSPGTWYDDKSHLYIWMLGNANPSTHIIEAVVNTRGNGMIRNWSSNGGQTNQYWFFQNLNLEYFATTGIETQAMNDSVPEHVWYDRIQAGGIGTGPVTNEGGMYGAAVYTKGSTSSTSKPTGPVTATEVHVTNGKFNNCGAHNCIGTDDSSGLTEYVSNDLGTAEHNQLDSKCPVNVLMGYNFSHGMWNGPLIGYDGTKSINSFYTEADWTACTNGITSMIGNTFADTRYGMFCNLGQNFGSPMTQICRMYNNTVYMQSDPKFNTAGLYFANTTGNTLSGDAENNIVYANAANSHGFRWSGSGTNNVIEKHNSYFNKTGTNTNSFGGTTCSTLSAWQNACGGGGKCGTNDQWQADPLLAPLQVKEFPLYATSPAINAGNPAVGFQRTMGSSAKVVQ
jgi:hypothetical protein